MNQGNLKGQSIVMAMRNPQNFEKWCVFVAKWQEMGTHFWKDP